MKYSLGSNRMPAVMLKGIARLRPDLLDYPVHDLDNSYVWRWF